MLLVNDTNLVVNGTMLLNNHTKLVLNGNMLLENDTITKVLLNIMLLVNDYQVWQYSSYWR